MKNEKSEVCKVPEGLSDWQIKAWIIELGSWPEERIAHEDFSQSYEMDMMHVLKLQNGKYATVLEQGCSCYESGDAKIEVFPTRKAAMASFELYVKESKSHGT